jgi:hypothetical protein
MAITQEREEMRIASQLKHDGWIHEMYDGNRSTTELREMADWCKQSFGPMYSQLYPNAWAGKWFGATLPFQDMGGSSHHVVFMFRDEKIHSLFKVMFPG